MATAAPASFRAAHPHAAAATASPTDIVRLANTERAEAGCPPLTINPKLTQAARRHSQDMARSNKLSHTGSDGSTLRERIDDTGYRWGMVGENAARGYRDASAAFEGWMGNPGHRSNIMHCSFRDTGVAVERGPDGTLWWAQTFAAPR